ncbi:AP2/ERF domain-containing protein [Artemisia annua]|uniref:AP2/ERF domain-containing protein n=1 Tax=Artemisia annua TaxID=35608 RepID=A0A2U1MK19_ARTAN|nr:AP2/ERF domain-containing protein [Artemisia annua]
MVKKELKIQTDSSHQTASSVISKKKYKGVRMRSWGSYVSEIRAPNQKTRIWLGSYSTPEAAARAYDAALLCVKGPTANLNFSPSQYDHAYSNTIMSPKSIQKIAAAAAASTTVTAPTSPPSPSYSYNDGMPDASFFEFDDHFSSLINQDVYDQEECGT